MIGRTVDEPESATLENADRAEAAPEKDQRGVLLEFAISLVVVLVMEQLLLPFADITKQRIEIGTTLLYSNLWWLLYGLIHPGSK